MPYRQDNLLTASPDLTRDVTARFWLERNVFLHCYTGMNSCYAGIKTAI